jgi:hypothetical protein
VGRPRAPFGRRRSRWSCSKRESPARSIIVTAAINDIDLVAVSDNHAWVGPVELLTPSYLIRKAADYTPEAVVDLDPIRRMETMSFRFR